LDLLNGDFGSISSDRAFYFFDIMSNKPNLVELERFRRWLKVKADESDK